MNSVTPYREIPAPMTARDYNAAQLSLIRRTVAKDCDNTEFDLFVEIARRVGLDPFRKQIYAIVTNKKSQDKRQLVVVTGIDGYRAIAARNGNYRPDEEEPEIVYRDDLKDPKANPLGIEKAVVRVWKCDAKGVWNPIKAAAYWDEFAPLKEAGEYKETGERWPDGNPKKEFVGNGTFVLDPNKANWKTMARVMIAKCAEAQALRKGWPEDLSGVYVAEEMDQAVIDVPASEVVEQHTREERLALVNASRSIPFQWEAGGEIEFVPVGKAADKISEFLQKSDSPTQVDAWRRINQLPLRNFWAENKSDALEIKKAIEARITQLEGQ